MMYRSARFQYLLWVFSLLILFSLDSFLTSGMGDKQIVGSWTVRFLYEFSVVLVLYSLFQERLRPLHLFPLSGFVYLLIWQEWIDNGFKFIVSSFSAHTGIEIPLYPQMGLIVLSLFSLLAVLFLISIGKRTSLRIYSSFILMAFMIFHVLVHWQAITNLKEREGLILDGYKMLTLSGDNFLETCERIEAVCFSGKYSKDVKEYSLTYRSATNKDVPEHDYFQPIDFDGVTGINDYAGGAQRISYTWSSNYLEFSTIDSPLKFISYHKVNDDVFIIIDDKSYLKTKQGVINLLKPFLLVFGIIWVLCGMGVFMMHDQRRR